jgi:hypothetical protein
VNKLAKIAARLAKDPKVIARVARSYANLQAGNSVDAFQFLKELKQQRSKAKAHDVSS